MSSQDTTAVRTCRDIDLQVFDGKVTKKCESGVYFQERTQTECAFVGARRGSKSLRAYPKTFYPFVRLAVLFEVPIETRATFAMFLGCHRSFVDPHITTNTANTLYVLTYPISCIHPW